MVNQYPDFNFRISNLSAAALIPQVERREERVERQKDLDLDQIQKVQARMEA